MMELGWVMIIVSKINGANRRLVLFAIGGFAYCLIELIWRGYSHMSMFAVGGVCFVLVGGIKDFLPWKLGLIWHCLIGGAIITIVELVSGLVLNVWLGLAVWNYSDLPLNFAGQICVSFSALWVLASMATIFIDNYLRHWLFHEQVPSYTLF